MIEKGQGCRKLKMSHNEALRSKSQLSLDTKFRFVICQEHIPISVCLVIPNREKSAATMKFNKPSPRSFGIK